MLKEYYIEIDLYFLHVRADDNQDFDSAFKALCLDTNEQLEINGWLADSIVEADKYV